MFFVFISTAEGFPAHPSLGRSDEKLTSSQSRDAPQKYGEIVAGPRIVREQLQQVQVGIN